MFSSRPGSPASTPSLLDDVGRGRDLLLGATVTRRSAVVFLLRGRAAGRLVRQNADSDALAQPQLGVSLLQVDHALQTSGRY